MVSHPLVLPPNRVLLRYHNLTAPLFAPPFFRGPDSGHGAVVVASACCEVLDPSRWGFPIVWKGVMAGQGFNRRPRGKGKQMVNKP